MSYGEAPDATQERTAGKGRTSGSGSKSRSAGKPLPEGQNVDWDVELTRCHEASFGWALHCCGYDRAEADEVLQTAYLKVLDGRARFGGRSQPKTFLFGVIRRTASERRRRERLGRLLPRNLAPPDPPASPHDDIARSRETRELLRAMGRLGRRQQQVLHLVFYGEMTIEEASGIMGVSLGTARTHYERGKKRLRELLSVSTPDAKETG